MASVETRIFAITGGASGIGAATARLLAHRGAAVVAIGDLSTQHFPELIESIKMINPSTKVHCTTLDVTSSPAVDEWVRTIVSTFGDLHGAANVAGIPQTAGLHQSPIIAEEDEATWKKIFAVNMDGVFYSTKAQVRAMRDLQKGDRSIVNVASMASLMHTSDVFAYGTSKVACAHFTTSVAKDTIKSGIRLNAVSPGATVTPLLGAMVPEAKTEEEVKKSWQKWGFELLDPNDIARTIVWLLSEDSRPVFGANINVGAGLP
ncbi:chanoclavine-I dehydrogenase easD [Aspergillus affinis]|uniref:chanoclavine-I dehydrogenase easD n=1 Tax=Aspergillus affinis TaxID=1070780 RepID=UPI0022FEA07D|nr:short chain dehydrogenase/oxidoreductase CpoX2 [Aspergillus affinis]KAI9035682.1 short chain dehydrogenase/oxidoreductase CpoX2 [Aspergillus affinis]